MSYDEHFCDTHCTWLDHNFNCKQMDKRMELYNVPNNSRIMLSNGDELFFHHIDGMYSYCTDSDGNTIHVPAWEEVEVTPREINE